MLTRGQVTLGILAGGQSRRLGGADKALAEFEGKSLLSRTLASLGAGFAEILVSYNGSPERLLQHGALVVLADLRAGFPGPLAGLESLLDTTRTEWLLTVPVDLLDIPAELTESLCGELATGAAHGGVAVRDADGLQPLVALWSVPAARAATTAALDAGDGAAHRLQQSLQFRIHDISPWRLGNLNTPGDFE